MDNFKGQYEQIKLKSAKGKIEKAKKDGYVLDSSNNGIEIYENKKVKDMIIFNTNTGDITIKKYEDSGNFGLNNMGLPGV